MNKSDIFKEELKTFKCEDIKEFATVLDIREDSVTEILEFVMENGIDLTIPVSQKSISSNIVNVFSLGNFS